LSVLCNSRKTFHRFRFRNCSTSRNLDLIELRDAKLFRGAAGEDGELVQGEFVFVVAAGDEAVDGDHAGVAEGADGRRCRVHDGLVD